MNQYTEFFYKEPLTPSSGYEELKEYERLLWEEISRWRSSFDGLVKRSGQHIRESPMFKKIWLGLHLGLFCINTRGPDVMIFDSQTSQARDIVQMGKELWKTRQSKYNNVRFTSDTGAIFPL